MMPYWILVQLRRLLLQAFTAPAASVLVFLRIGFGQRALSPLHLVIGVAALGAFAQFIEPQDIANARDARAPTAQHLPAATFPGLPQSRPLPSEPPAAAGKTDAEAPHPAMLAKSFDDTPYMRYYALAFTLVCSAQLAFIYWGSLLAFRLWPFDRIIPGLARQGDYFRAHPMHSRMQGEPVLYVLMFRRKYWLTVIVLEPLLLLVVGYYFQLQLARPLSGVFFYVCAFYLHVLALGAYRVQQAEMLDLQDARIEAEAYASLAEQLEQGRKPTARSTGRFFPFVSPQDPQHGVTMLRRLAQRNRDMAEASTPERAATCQPQAPAPPVDFSAREIATGEVETEASRQLERLRAASEHHQHPAPTPMSEPFPEREAPARKRG